MRRIITVLIVVTLLAGCGGLRGDSRSYRMEKETNYLVEHSLPINVENIDSTVDTLEGQVRSQNIILAGEVPGVSGNSELQRHFFEAFNDVRNIDYLVAEIPYSAGELLNSYFSERNEESLNKVFENLIGRPYATEENRSFFRQLKLYLKNQGDKVKIVGIDYEYAPSLTLEYLASVMEGHDLAEYPVAKELVDARDRGFFQADYLKITLLKLHEELKADPVKGADVFKNDFKSVTHVLENLEKSYEQSEIDVDEQFSHTRSDQLVKNFLAVYDLAPEAVYFGQLANPAVMQSEHMNYDWFASAIQKERNTIKGKVLSILYTYEDCQRMVQVAGKAEKETLDLFKFDDRKMNNAINQPYTLISLIDKSAMFDEESIIFEKDFTGAVTEYFQYLVVVNESPASKELK